MRNVLRLYAARNVQRESQIHTSGHDLDENQASLCNTPFSAEELEVAVSCLRRAASSLGATVASLIACLEGRSDAAVANRERMLAPLNGLWAATVIDDDLVTAKVTPIPNAPYACTHRSIQFTTTRLTPMPCQCRLAQARACAPSACQNRRIVLKINRMQFTPGYGNQYSIPIPRSHDCAASHVRRFFSIFFQDAVLIVVALSSRASHAQHLPAAAMLEFYTVFDTSLVTVSPSWNLFFMVRRCRGT